VTASGREEVPEDIARELAARGGRLGGFARRLVYLESTSSTNDVADRLAADSAPHGTVVTADAQHSGRGRMGRSWFSPPGAGLYTSIVLRPEAFVRPPGDGARGVAAASVVSLTSGVAIAEGIRAASGLDVHIKWPNDLLVERRKLCGILAEASATAAGVQHVILGYGINLRPAAYPPEIADRATSLESELGRAVDRAAVLAETLACLAERLSPDGPGFEAMLARWRELSPMSAGARVEVVEGGQWVAGTTAGIDDDGALLVSAAGEVRRVIAGEVRWLP
jgi:BirA family transcriptional regulator, biotin operon repressor / biotin---[acetyl-CoA-carboxylase] ligase